MATTLGNDSWRIVRKAELVELSPPTEQEEQSPTLNVVIVPDTSPKATLAAFPDRAGHLVSLFKDVDARSRVLEFRYSISKPFSWVKLIGYGDTLLECLLEAADQYALRENPLIIVSHGFGGCITKKAMSTLHEQYYNHALRPLAESVRGLIFLGTPHTLYNKSGHIEKLDSLLLSTLRLSSEMLTKIREEVGFMWNVSSKFEEVNFQHPVLSAYELQPTKFGAGFLRSRREILVDQNLATTHMRHEQLIGINTDHQNVHVISVGTEIFAEIRKLAKEVTSSMTKVQPKISLHHIWLSTPAASEVDPVQGRPNSRLGAETPMGATAGSSNVAAGYEIVPIKKEPVSMYPAVKLPCYVLRQYSRAGECFDRQDILEMLDKELLPPADTDHSQTNPLRTFAICGLGGLGKTQIAVEFAITRKHHFDAVFFIYADSETKLAESFNTIAEELGLSDKSSVVNPVINRDLVVEWLNSPLKYPRDSQNEDAPPSSAAYANYLLVFDNADEPELLTEYWPLAGTGSILITSRDPLTKSHIYSNNGVDLTPFNENDAAKFLQSLTHFASPEDQQQARKIADRLGGLPLALTQIAGLILRKRLSFSEFLALYREPSFMADVHRSRERGFYNNYERMLFDVWTFENLKPEALCLLEFCSLLDPDRIPESIFLTNTAVAIPNFPVTAVTFESARTELLKSSLLQRLQGEPMLSMHRVVQDAVRVRMSKSHFRAHFISAVDLLTEAWPAQALSFAVEPALWAAYAQLLPHVEHLAKTWFEFRPYGDDPAAASKFAALIIKAGWFQYERGNYSDSLTTFEWASRMCALFPEQLRKDSADLDFCISCVASFIKDWHKKRIHTARDVEYRIQHPEDKLALGIAYNEMSFYHNENGMFRQAVIAGIQAVEAFDHIPLFGNKEQLAMNPRLNCANAHIFMNELDEAESYAVMCLEWLESSDYHYNFNANRTGNTFYVMGNLRQAQGRLDESRLFHLRALDHYSKTLGEAHPQSLKSRIKVADHCARLGEHDAAIQHLDAALEGWGERPYFSPERARALHKKSLALKSLNQEILAEGVQVNAEKIWKDWFRESHSAFEPVPEVIDFDKEVPFWQR